MFALLAALALPAGVAAQSRSLPFARLSIADGLSQGTVRCLLQDTTGFLWLGTQDGLNRYDGYGFVVYKHDPADPSSLPSNWIEDLALDPSGDVWVGTQGGGLARWRQATNAFERFPAAPDGGAAALPGDSVRALHLDRAGDLWVGTFQSGLARLDRESGRFEVFRHDPKDDASLVDDRVRSIYEDSAGHLWVGTLAGLGRLDRDTGAFAHTRHDPADPASLSDDRVTSILEDDAGVLWIGTEKGLDRRRLRSDGFDRFHHDPADPSSLSHDLVWALSADRAGRLWVGTDGGLNLLAPSGDGFVRYRHDPADPLSLSNDRVRSLFEDAAGLLWIGTVGGGVNKWNPITWSFAHFRGAAAGLSSNNVFAFSEDRGGRLWIGTSGGGLARLDRSTGELTQYRHDPLDPKGLAGDQVLALLHDRDGVLWVGVGNRGLGRFDAAEGKFRNFRHDPERATSLSDDAVTALWEDSAGALWVATFRGGLNRFDRESETFRSFRHHPDRPASLSDDALTTLTGDSEGRLWIGTLSSGLNRLERLAIGGDGEFLRLRHEAGRPESLSNDTVYALHADAAGRLWVGTQAGLNLLADAASGGSFRHYLERDGLAGDAVYGIRHDVAGRLWIATGGGLSRFDPSTGLFKSYNVSHGLQSNEFNFGAHFAAESGELFFGGTGGFNAFFPDAIEANDHVPPVVLTAFRRTDEPLSPQRPLFAVEGIELSWRDYFFELEVAALDFTAPEENRYRYKLEGFDAGWVDLGHRRRMTFTNLDPGRYVLRVVAANNDGVWNEEGLTLPISITPPWWKTWWATALWVLALAAAVAGVARQQGRKLARERERVKERERLLEERGRLIAALEAKNADLEHFNYTLSHDLRTPLVTISGFLGLLKRDALAGDVERLEHDVRRISDAANRMRRILDEILELSRLGRTMSPTREVALKDLTCEAVEILRDEIDRRGVEVRVAPDLPVVSGDRVRLLEVLQSLLENAVKYLGEERAPRVEVGVRREGASEIVYVRDNGIGIEPRYHDKVFGLFERLDADDEGTGIGLALVKRIVELHGGRIWVESEGNGRGSTFCFTLGGALRQRQEGIARVTG